MPLTPTLQGYRVRVSESAGGHTQAGTVTVTVTPGPYNQRPPGQPWQERVCLDRDGLTAESGRAAWAAQPQTLRLRGSLAESES